MTKNEFIEQIATYVKKYAPQYGIKVHSPIIAQACIESAYGTSELATNCHNYFGLKWRDGRCKTAVGKYIKVGSEQNKDGSYVSSPMEWCKFLTMETGVIGYFDFTNIPNYSGLKGVTDPELYLKTIKEAGYATSLNYVKTLMDCIATNNLTRFDKKEENMGYSPLCSKIIPTPKCNKIQNKVNKYIVIHHMAGIMTAEGCAVYHRDKAQASANYYIGNAGEIVGSVDEGARAWTTGSYAVDSQAITYEVSNSTGSPDWKVSSAAMEATINLTVDVCKRNGIKELRFTGDKSGNLHMHCWYQATGCPGPYMKTMFAYIANEVNKRMGLTGQNLTTQAATNKIPGYIIGDMDYSAVFDADFYAKWYPDVVKVYGSKPADLWRHFVEYGMKEGRAACGTFNPNVYRSLYKDVEALAGDNYPLYYKHWILFGKKEGRKGA